MVPLFGIHIDQLGLGKDAGIRAHDVEAALDLGSLVNHGLDAGPVADIALRPADLAALGVQLGDRRLGSFTAARGDGDLGALPGEDAGNAKPDAL